MTDKYGAYVVGPRARCITAFITHLHTCLREVRQKWGSITSMHAGGTVNVENKSLY